MIQVKRRTIDKKNKSKGKNQKEIEFEDLNLTNQFTKSL